MKGYTVSEISKMLNTNPETVRRWIRNGQLKANKTSRKSGNIVSETDLKKFMEATPKYSSLAQLMPLAPLALPVFSILTGAAISSLLNLLFADQDKKSNEDKLKEDDLKEMVAYLNEQIKVHKDTLDKKRKTMDKLQEDISEEEKEINSLEQSIREINEYVKEGEVESE